MANNNVPIKIEFGGIDNVSPILGTLALKFNGITKQIETLNKTVQKISFAADFIKLKEMTNLFKDFTTQVKGVVTTPIDAYSNIEDNIGRLAILLEKKPSDQFLGGLKKQWKDLSEVSTMSASEISDVSKDIVNAGNRSEETISKLTNLSVLIADASKREMNASESFGMLNEFKSSFNLKNEKLEEVADQIVYGKDHGKASFHDIHEGFKYAAPTWGAISNAVPADYLAFNAVLSSHGIQGSSVGTALRRLPMQFVEKLDKKTLTSLGKNADPEMLKTLEDFKSNAHNSVLKLLGLKFEDISDESHKKIDIIKALQLIKKNLPKYAADKQISIIQKLFGQEAVSTGLTALQFLDEIIHVDKEIKEKSSGKADELASQTRNTLRSEITKTQNAWDNFKISILDTTTGDTLKYISKKFKEIANDANNLSDSTKVTIGVFGTSAYVFSDVAEKLMPILVSIKLIKDGLKSLTVVTAAWNAVCSLNPLVWIIGGALIAVGALSYGIYKLTDDFDGFKKSLDDTAKNTLPKFLSTAIYDDKKNKHEEMYNNAFTPEEKQKIYAKNILDSFDGGKTYGNIPLVPIQSALLSDPNSITNMISKAKDEQKKRNISNIFNNYNKEKIDNKVEGKSEIIVSFKNPPEGISVVQQTKNMEPAKIKMGSLGDLHL